MDCRPSKGGEVQFTGWDEWAKKCGNPEGNGVLILAKAARELVRYHRGFLFPNGLKSLFFIGSSLRGGTGLRPCSAGAGEAVGDGVFSAQAECNQEFHLRVRPGVQGRCLDAIPLGLLPVCDYLSDFRCGSGVSAPVCRGIHGAWGGGLCFDADRKSTRLNSSHLGISYAVFCLDPEED